MCNKTSSIYKQRVIYKMENDSYISFSFKSIIFYREWIKFKANINDYIESKQSNIHIYGSFSFDMRLAENYLLIHEQNVRDG